MYSDKSWRKSCLKAGIICSLGAAVIGAGSVGLMIGGGIFSWRGHLNEAKAYDNYRLEELQKVQEKFDNGEISNSEFDVRVSYINGTEDLSVFRNIWVEEGHEDCCEKLYKTAIKDASIGAGLVLASVTSIAGAGILGMVARENFRDL